MAALTSDILHRIVCDIASTVNGPRSVGWVGGYARGDFTPASDVDLVFDLDPEQVDETLVATALRLRRIFMDQFRAGLGIIKYGERNACLAKPEKLTHYQRLGYQQM